MELNLSAKGGLQSRGLYWPYWLKFLVLAWIVQLPTCFCCQAQAPQTFIYQLVPIDAESGDIVYSALMPVAGASTTQLYNRAHRFLAHTLHAGSLLPVTHRSKRQINRCGVITLQPPQLGTNRPGDYRVTIELKVKPGRYRYRLSQFKAYPDSTGQGLAIRELYPYDKQTYEHSASTAQQLRAWDCSVKAYLRQLHAYMLGRQEGAYVEPL